MLNKAREYTKPKRKPEDITGVTFGRLTAKYILGSYKNEHYWACECSCGNLTEVATNKLKTGNTVSCGCAKVERMQAINKGHVTHGKSRTRVYAAWCNMMARVYNQADTHYARYGGRGICVEDRFHDFQEFLAYMGDCPAGLTLERVDNDVGYVTGNMVWDTDYAQRRNMSTNVLVSLNGK